MSVAINQASDRISRTASAPNLGSGATFAAWVYLISDLNANQTVVRFFETGTILTFATDVDGTSLNAFTANGGVLAVDPFVVGEWRYVAFTQSGSTVTVYTSLPGGVLHSASGSIGVATPPTGFTLGGRSTTDASEWGNFRFAHVREWQTVLTPSELVAERDSVNVVKTAGLWASYPLDTAANLNDSSGNGRHLTAGSTSPTTAEGPPISGGGGTEVANIQDQARVNMLAALGLAEPQQLTNVDLMRMVLETPGQTLVTKTDASAAVHYWRYLASLR